MDAARYPAREPLPSPFQVPMDIFYDILFGWPVWLWAAFVGIVFLLLVLDLGVLNRGDREMGVRKSLTLSALYIGAGLVFAAAVYWIYLQNAPVGGLDPSLTIDDPQRRARLAAQLYLTGFIVEKTLALDNVFVISLIFGFFGIPVRYQHRVLVWGIVGVLVLRALMIGLGATLVSRFDWILYVFAVFLVWTGIAMLRRDHKPDLTNSRVLDFLRRHLRVTDDMEGNRFVVVRPHPETGAPVRWFTPLFLALVLVELADLVFAMDSVPAIFAITEDPFIVYTSNIFAILGLRALYFALAAMIVRFYYLKYALAATLVFIGSKIFIGDLFFTTGKFPAGWSLAITLGLIAGGIVYSLYKTKNLSKAQLAAHHEHA